MECWNSYLLFVVAIGPVSRILVAFLHTLRSILEIAAKDALIVPVTSPMNAIPPTENAEEGSDSQRFEHSKCKETPLAAPDTQRNTSVCLSR